MVLRRFCSACSAYSSEETSCIDQSLARRTLNTAPTPTASPTSRDEVVFSLDESEPPDARGAAPPMSKVKFASARPNTRNTTTSATARTTQTMTMTRERSMDVT